MPTPEAIDLDFRPDSYFSVAPIRTRTPGQEKLRTRILAMLMADDQDGLAELKGDALDTLLDIARTEKLPTLARETIGKLHPAFMGGQYLPPLAEDEVEIASVHFRTVLADVIVIVASEEQDRIAYHVYDEYETEYRWQPRTSNQPLTLGEMIGLIDSIQLIDDSPLPDSKGQIHHVLVSNIDPATFTSGREQWESFVRVDSPFYPQLTDYYRETVKLWLTEAEQ